MQLKKKTTSELIEMYRNARTTYNLAGGHKKAEMNEIFMKQYMNELESRNLTDRENELLKANGKFNGVGAY